MANCNIPSTNTDPQYRYKMPKIVTKVEGSGIGIKTRVVNMGDVAKALKTSPQYLVKWFATELGTQARFTHDVREGERAIINGARAAATLQSELDNFIEKYILCEKCGLPETDMYVKSGVLRAKCKACGKRCELDNNHKVAGMIAKHLPTKENKSEDKENSSEDAKQVKHKRGEKKDVDNSSAKQVKQRHGEKKDKCGKDEKEEVRAKQKSGAGHKIQPQHKLAEVIGANTTIEIENGADEVGDVIRLLSEIVGNQDEVVAIAVQDFFSELRAHQVAKGFDNRMRLYVVFEALFGPTMNAQKLKQQKHIVNHVISNASMPPADILWVFNLYLGRNAGIISTFPLCLKVAYDEDWCEEVNILDYYNNNVGEGEEGFAEAKVAAAPLLKWLATVDSESEDSPDDDE